MRGHEEFERILAAYRDASPGERAAADAHVASCAHCAARLVGYEKTDSLVRGLDQPALPVRLAQPLQVVLRDRQSAGATHAAHRFVLTPALASAAAIMLLLVALSVLMWSRDISRAPVTLTPTLTTTLTPTTVSARETEPAGLVHLAGTLALGPHVASGARPTPAPAPVPVVANSPVFWSGFSPRATISH